MNNTEILHQIDMIIFCATDCEDESYQKVIIKELMALRQLVIDSNLYAPATDRDLAANTETEIDMSHPYDFVNEIAPHKMNA